MSTTDYGTARKIDLWKFRSSKSHKWYIVEVEYFPMHFLVRKLLPNIMTSEILCT